MVSPFRIVLAILLVPGDVLVLQAAVIQSLLGGAVLKLCHTAIGQRRSAATWSTSINAKGDGDSEATDCCTSMFVVAFPFLMREEGQLA